MKIINKFTLSLIITFCVILMLNSCKEKEENLPEDITTLQLMVTDLTDPNLNISNFYSRDLDLKGSSPAKIDEINLLANHEYAVEVKLLNEENGGMLNITGELWAEKDDHLFVFKVSGANLTAKATDTDSKNLPVGLTSTFKTTAISKGTLAVTLFHQSDKNNPYGSGTNEYEAIFPVVVK